MVFSGSEGMDHSYYHTCHMSTFNVNFTTNVTTMVGFNVGLEY